MSKPKPQHLAKATVPLSHGSSGTTVAVEAALDRTNQMVHLKFDARAVTGAERSFPADGAVARLRHGSPELHFVQLDAFDEKRISRIVIVRFEAQRFIDRANQNETFRKDLEEVLLKRKDRGVPGYHAKLVDEAQTPGAPAAIIDAELDLASWTGGRAAILFMVGSPQEIRAVAMGEKNRLFFTADLEATLPTRALADLLQSWKNLADQMVPAQGTT